MIECGISELVEKVVDFIYAFIAGSGLQVRELSSAIVLGLFIAMLVGVAVLLTEPMRNR